MLYPCIDFKKDKIDEWKNGCEEVNVLCWMNRLRNKEVKMVRKGEKKEDSNVEEDVKSGMGWKKLKNLPLSVYSVNRINLGVSWNGNKWCD